jgi:hypothetical protein
MANGPAKARNLTGGAPGFSVEAAVSTAAFSEAARLPLQQIVNFFRELRSPISGE